MKREFVSQHFTPGLNNKFHVRHYVLNESDRLTGNDSGSMTLPSTETIITMETEI